VSRQPLKWKIMVAHLSLWVQHNFPSNIKITRSISQQEINFSRVQILGKWVGFSGRTFYHVYSVSVAYGNKEHTQNKLYLQKIKICLKSFYRLLLLGDLHCFLVPLLIFAELGKLRGYESRNGNLYYVRHWRASDLLVWNSADTTRKTKYIRMLPAKWEGKSNAEETYGFILNHSFLNVSGVECERRGIWLRLGGNSYPISAMSDIHHCYS
jgi:hypothetical protein